MTDMPDRERGGGDRDLPYTFDRPAAVYLTVHQRVALMLMRSRLEDRHLLRHRGSDDPPATAEATAESC